MSKKQILIFQTSPLHTGSTILVNALYGLIEQLKYQPILGDWDDLEKRMIDESNNVLVIKSHNLDIDNIMEKYKDKYELFFICSQRPFKNKFINQKYISYNNVIIFNFIELNETENNTIPQIIDTIYEKLYKLLCNYEIKLNKESGIERIINMNKRYEKIKHNNFDYIDDFFELHGSHRNRIE